MNEKTPEETERYRQWLKARKERQAERRRKEKLDPAGADRERAKIALALMPLAADRTVFDLLDRFLASRAGRDATFAAKSVNAGRCDP